MATDNSTRKDYDPECKYCVDYRYDSMCPHHDAGDRCKSSKRSHCTCDSCY